MIEDKEIIGETTSRKIHAADHPRGGSVGLAGAALLGIASCSQQESENENSGGLVNRGDISGVLASQLRPVQAEASRSRAEQTVVHYQRRRGGDLGAERPWDPPEVTDSTEGRRNAHE
jgi:hypothetical protein